VGLRASGRTLARDGSRRGPCVTTASWPAPASPGGTRLSRAATFPPFSRSATCARRRSSAAAARGPRTPPGRTAMAMIRNKTTPRFHMARSSKRSAISNANAAAIAAQYTQEYRTPYGPGFPCLSTRLRMERLSCARPSRSTAVPCGRGHARHKARTCQQSTAKSPPHRCTRRQVARVTPFACRQSRPRRGRHFRNARQPVLSLGIKPRPDRTKGGPSGRA
jgi:hypothetical protein